MSLQGSADGKNVLRGKLNRLYELRGYSAYEVAVINGFEGTEEEWLDSLKGGSGSGSGDMLASIYDPQGKKTDVFKAISDLREEWQASLIVPATVE